MLDENILNHFGVDEPTFLRALKLSPSARGYIMGAISEVLLSDHLEAKGYEVKRIKEKPAGGNKAKSDEARGDFYIRKKSCNADKWLIVESKGLKSNSEFRGSKLDSQKKVFKFLSNRIFGELKTKETIYKKGYEYYSKAKEEWENENHGKKFPEFTWSKEFPGSETYDLDEIWPSEEELEEWVNSRDKEDFTEQAYRDTTGAIVILESHQPGRRIGTETGIDRAAPLACDFNIMGVDLFLRTGKHEFVFMNPEEISHSPTSPEHLYQNYIIDILVKDKKHEPTIKRPWYLDIDECIDKTSPTYRSIEHTQIDDR